MSYRQLGLCCGVTACVSIAISYLFVLVTVNVVKNEIYRAKAEIVAVVKEEVSKEMNRRGQSQYVTIDRTPTSYEIWLEKRSNYAN